MPEIITEGYFKVTNTGNIPVTIISAEGEVPILGTVPELPYELAVGEVLLLYVQNTSDIRGTSLGLLTSCGDTIVIEWPDPTDTCSFVITNGWCDMGQQDPEIPNSFLQEGNLMVQNTGGFAFDITDIDSDLTIFESGPAPVSLPVTVNPGETAFIYLLHDGETEGEIRGTEFTVTLSCGETFTDNWVNGPC